MRRADDIGAAQFLTSGRDAEVPSVVGDGAFHALDELPRATSGTLRVFEPALEADVSRAFEGRVVARELGSLELHRASRVVELPAARNQTFFCF